MLTKGLALDAVGIGRVLLVLLLLAECLTPTIATSDRMTLPVAPRHVVAITFDDLPYVNEGSKTPVQAAIAAQHRIVQALRREHVPATGFVNEDKVQALGAVGPRLLVEWNRGLLALGNHGYSHFDSNDLDVAGIEREIVKGESTIRPMADAAGHSIPFFRFPYNHVGDTEAKRVAIAQVLADHGYTLAASTIDTSDYMFNTAYERAFAARKTAAMKQIKRAYLDYSRIQIAYYDRLDRRVIGRDVPAIMLLHVNRLNAATIKPLLELFRSAGYGFVSLAEAQVDPVYSAMPAVATKYGPMWGYRWARERRLKVDGRLEQEPPAWISTPLSGAAK